MGKNTDRRPPAVSATINLAGYLTPQIATFQAGAGAHITLTVHTVVLRFMDRHAALHYDQAWNTEAGYVAGRLPEVHHLAAEPTIGLTVRTSHHDTTGVLGNGLRKLTIRTGPLTWVIHDQVAYEALSQAHTQVAKLAPLVLPDRY